MSSEQKTSYITCPLCEATCGLEVVTQDRQILSIRGDNADVLSRGYLCPKAYSLKELHSDPDRLRQPMVRHGDQWQMVSWDEAFAEIERRLLPIVKEHGRNALAVYQGNPNVHNLSSLLYGPNLLRTMGSQNIYSASTVDQIPKQVAVGLMFGHGLSVPIPDLERTDYLLILGANPLVSNGSLLTAPDMRGRLRALRKRGGKVVVIDPVRTRTADEADAHYFIRPGGDAYLLFGIVYTLFEENLAAPGRLAEYANGLEQLQTLSQAFAPEQVAAKCGIAPATIRELARELAHAPHAAVYGRIGTCTQEFGTLASWLVDVVNFLTGNLDRVGGVLFPKGAAGAANTRGKPGVGRGIQLGRWSSRVSGMPEVLSELPVACLAEEIETAGKDQIRAMITIAGNPILSNPNGERLQKAFSKLDFMLSIDLYLNETTRHADVILPALSPLEHDHYDIVFYQFATHNVANYTPPLFEPDAESLDEWEILLKLTALLNGDPERDPARLDDAAFLKLVQIETRTPGSIFNGRNPAEIAAEFGTRRGPARILDFLLRTGPYGDTKPEGLSLDVLEKQPHGVDLGPLEPRIPEVLRTPSGKIELTPEPIVTDVARLQAGLEAVATDGLVLIGRRDLRSNNSWMHNLNVLVKGENRCTLLLNPTDAERLQIANGETVGVRSRVGQIQIVVETTDTIMAGVVSIPHGWGHNLTGTALQIAENHAGVNTNLLTDEAAFDKLSGNSILNGIPITLERV